MRTRSLQRLFLTALLALFSMSAITLALPAAATASTISSTGSISGCGNNNSYGCSYWWDWSLMGNAYPGQTVYFAFNLYNTDPFGETIRINSFEVMTPWANYTDPSLPQEISAGYSYSNSIEITIPANQTVGLVQGGVVFTGDFPNGTPWCSSTGNVCSDLESLGIIASPTALQAQITSLQSQAATLDTQISALNDRASNLSARVATLTSRLAQADGNLSTSKQTIAADQAALTSAQNNLSTAQGNLATAQSQLSDTNAQLASKQAELASTQSSLNTTSDIYLPLAAAVPAIVAALFAVLYFKKSFAYPSYKG